MSWPSKEMFFDQLNHMTQLSKSRLGKPTWISAPQITKGFRQA